MPLIIPPNEWHDTEGRTPEDEIPQELLDVLKVPDKFFDDADAPWLPDVL
jgi:hypothetical protein